MDFNDIKKIVVDTAGDIKDTSTRLYKSAKISVDISKKQNNIDDLYTRIGKLIYKSHCGELADSSAVNALCEEIDTCFREIEGLTETKAVLKANKKCDVCGCTVHPEDETCPNCGCEL